MLSSLLTLQALCHPLHHLLLGWNHPLHPLLSRGCLLGAVPVSPRAPLHVRHAPGHSRRSGPTAVQGCGRWAGRRHIPGILPAPMGGRGVKPAKRREKQIKLLPFSRNNCLPNYGRNYRPSGEVEGEESSVGRGQESWTWGAVCGDTHIPLQPFPASAVKPQDGDPGSGTARDMMMWQSLSGAGAKLERHNSDGKGTPAQGQRLSWDCSSSSMTWSCAGHSQ